MALILHFREVNVFSTRNLRMYLTSCRNWAFREHDMSTITSYFSTKTSLPSQLFYTTMYLLLTSSVNKVSSQFKISFRSYQKFWIYGIQSKMHQSTLGFRQYFGLSQVNNPKFCDSGHMSNYSNIRGINCTGIIILCLLLKHKTSRKCFWNKSSISFFGQKGFVKAEFNITEKISMNESR